MQLSSTTYQLLNNEADRYSSQVSVPPPYQEECQDECLPRYMDGSDELECILDQFAPRWDNQRIHRSHCNEKSSAAAVSTRSTAFEKTSHLLDRMEDYRHIDQEWTCQSGMKRMQMMNNMYHIYHKPSSSCCTANKKLPSLSSSAKSKYYKVILSIAKEREHIVHKMKKLQQPSPSKTKPAATLCKNEFDHFLNSIHHTSSQFEMANQRATLIIPTI